MTMVQRLNAAQTRQIIRDLVPQGLCNYSIPEPVSAERVEEFCSGVAAQATGRCYGWFDANFVPRGFLVGMIVLDPMTGLPHGLEHAWWSAWKGRPALDLLHTFEKDCEAEGCTRVTLGCSEYVDPIKTKVLYHRLGYTEYNTALSKELA
jgi:hypothetical protein